jgi:hypothetical protein
VQDVTSTSYEEQANWAGTLKKALCSVRDHPMRVYDAQSLGSLKFIGPAIQEVRRHPLHVIPDLKHDLFTPAHLSLHIHMADVERWTC